MKEDSRVESEKEEEVQLVENGSDGIVLDPEPVQPDHQEYPALTDYTPDYMELLQQIQNRIADYASIEPTKLDAVITLIQETGCYATESGSFDFDLCLLDRQTVKKIQRYLDIRV